MVRRLPAKPGRPEAPDDQRWPVAESDEGWAPPPNGRYAPAAEPEEERWVGGPNRRPPMPPPEDHWQGAPDDRYAPAPDPDQDRWEAARNRRRAQTAEADDDYWEAERGRRRAEPIEADEERWESTQSRRRTGRLRVEVPPIVNPYSIIALIAALLGLFPVALVFGLISFGHPRGRAMAMFALLIGILEVVVLAGVIVLSGVTLPRTAFGSDPTPTAATTVVTVAATPTPPPVPTTAVAPPTAAGPPTVAKGEACTQAQAGLIGAAADGSTLLCLRGGGAYRWAGPNTVSTAVHEGGSKCIPGTDTTARTTDGHALVCEGQGRGGTWSLWVE
ncbi:DUF4190 domain-containing protein [Nocardia mexicana]|uniref:DUF4190 domain-containing protein n=1 Tax=Nocardia mexicana TaxID=279262 RepID=A0A370GX10_9NOCA|nr:DUF4190 domain-containing protein [Nocardia mexicana]RDI48225.1 hypothetical protein DFR68_10854 [Nocardia mexicana]